MLKQSVDSQAVYGNVGYHFTDAFRVSAGLRYTQDEKDAGTNINSSLIVENASRDWSETSWDLSGNYQLSERMNVYGTIQSGYQSGQFPPRPFCLFGFLDFTQPGNVSRPNCFVANDNVTARNLEFGIKGQPFDSLQMSIAVFYTDYSDLPYQVSTTAGGGGFNTVNIIVDQTSKGVEWEGLWQATDWFRLHSTIGYIDADVDDPNPAAVAPLTPELTASLSPEFSVPLGAGNLTVRADYSFRDEMFGEPSSDPGRFTLIDSRDLVNVSATYEPTGGDWSISAYGKNVTDERYDNGRLNTGDYILVIMSNDAREYGVRLTKEF
jgi:iron complex outermembrane receptor protein